MLIIVQGSREHQAFQAFLKQSIYDSLRSTPGCLEGVDRRALHSIHPSGIDQARKYLREIGKDEAYFKPDPSMVNSYVTYMCETKKFGGGGNLPLLPQEYVQRSYALSSSSIEDVENEGTSSNSPASVLLSAEDTSKNSDFVFPSVIFFGGALFGALGMQCFMKYYVLIASSSVGSQAKLRRPEL